MVTASFGDALLSRGMEQVGPVTSITSACSGHALLNPYILGGTILLIGFFAAYMTALSWADLTFVMPATAFGYVITALLSRYWLHEHLSPYRWARHRPHRLRRRLRRRRPSRTDTGVVSPLEPAPLVPVPLAPIPLAPVPLAPVAFYQANSGDAPV